MKIRLTTCLCLALALAGCDKGTNPAAPNADAAPAQTAPAVEISKADQPADAKTLAEIQALFESLQASDKSGDTDAILKQISTPLMLRACEESGVYQPASPDKRQQLLNTLSNAVRDTWLVGQQRVFSYGRFKVVRAEASGDGKFAVATVRLWQWPYDMQTRMRWWLVRDSGWKIYDWEWLDTGMRAAWLAPCLSSQIRLRPSWSRAATSVQDGCIRYLRGKGETAGPSLEYAADKGLPEMIEAVRLEQLGAADVSDGEYRAAIRRCNDALELRAEFPAAIYMRGCALFNDGRYDAAASDLRWYLDDVGSDPRAMIVLGDVLTWLDKYDEARTIYEAGLQDLPEWGLIAGLAICLKEEEAPLLADWFNKLEDKRKDYALLMNNMYIERSLFAGARAIHDAYASVAKDDPVFEYYTGRFLLADDKPAEALDHLRKAVAGASEVDKAVYNEWLWEAAHRDGKAVETLTSIRSLEEAATAFLFFARAAAGDSDTDAIDALCEVYAKRGPKDPILHFYRGESAFMKEDWPTAEGHFRTGLTLRQVNESYERALRHGLLDSMQKQGRGLAAYTELQRSDDTFAYLTGVLFTDERAEALDAVIKAHVRTHPKDVLLFRARGDLAWLKQEWKTAAQEYARYINPDRSSDSGYWGVAERNVRACVRAEDFEGAMKAAREAFAYPDDWLIAVVYAVQDKTEEAMRALDEYIENDDDETARFYVEELYKDKDVGEKFRGEAYAKLHERFPVPPPEPEAPVEPEDDSE